MLLRVVPRIHFQIVFGFVVFLMLSGSTLKAADPELHYVGTKWDVYGRFVSVLTFENKSGRPLYFLGEDFNLPFLVKATPGRGETKILDDYSGADDLIYSNLRFDSGKSIRFDGWNQPKAGEAWKMGLRYTFNAQKDAKLERIAWSETITGSPSSSVLPTVSSRVYLEGHREKNSERAYRFLLKNISRKPLYYIGYRESKVPPKLELETEKQIHFWRNEGEVQGDWGGTGLGFQSLAPGQSKSFELPPQRNIHWRIGVRLFRTVNPTKYDDAYDLVWWPPQSPYL